MNFLNAYMCTQKEGWKKKACGLCFLYPGLPNECVLGPRYRRKSWLSWLEYSVCWLFTNRDMSYIFSLLPFVFLVPPLFEFNVFFFSSQLNEMQLDRASALWMSLSSCSSLVWPCNFPVRGVEVKALVVADDEAWDWSNPEYSIDFIPCCFQRSPI